jgi:hypothetical protein
MRSWRGIVEGGNAKYFASEDTGSVFPRSVGLRRGAAGAFVRSRREATQEGERREKLSPVLLVRVPDEARLLVADGYHRVCAAYLRNEDEPVPCQIA